MTGKRKLPSEFELECDANAALPATSGARPVVGFLPFKREQAIAYASHLYKHEQQQQRLAVLQTVPQGRIATSLEMEVEAHLNVRLAYRILWQQQPIASASLLSLQTTVSFVGSSVGGESSGYRRNCRWV